MLLEGLDVLAAEGALGAHVDGLVVVGLQTLLGVGLHVDLEVAPGGRPVLADLALVGLLPRVASYVRLEAAGVHGGVGAQVALVLPGEPA